MRVLVTGGAGFIGSHLCAALLEQAHEVVCLDSFEPICGDDRTRANARRLIGRDRFELVEADVRDPAGIERAFGGPRFDRVVHLAALAGVRRSLEHPQAYAEVDFIGTINLLQAAHGHDAGGFILGSTSSIYGTNPRVPFREDAPVELQASPYAVAKRAAELYCGTHHRLYGTPITILRFFTVYGPRQRPEMAISLFLRKLLAGEPLPLFGDGESTRDYTYVADIVAGIIAAMELNAPLELFNLGCGRPISLAALADLLSEVTGLPGEIEWLPEQPGDVPHTYADIFRARERLAYAPRDVRSGLEATWAARDEGAF